MTAKKLAMRLVTGFAVVMLVCAPAGSAPAPAQIDHILLGIDDLDRGMDSFEQLTGVRPVAEAPATQLRLSLSCPKGSVEFD